MTTWKLLSPATHFCQECAVEHDPKIPHNLHSLYYQTKFFMRNQRYPTWNDAMAHCTDEIKNQWIKALIEKGVELEKKC